MTVVPDSIAHRTALKRFFHSRYSFTFFSALAVSGLAFADRWIAYSKLPPPNPWIGLGVLLVLATSFLASMMGLWRILRDFKADVIDAPQYALEAVLFTINEYLNSTRTKGKPEPKIRLCLYVPDDTGTQLMQKTPYVGSAESSGHNMTKKHHHSKGVIGEAFRTGKVAHCKMKNGTSRIDVLLGMGYTKSEAIEMRGDATCWIAVPISHPNRENSTFAVLFADSADPCFFDNNFQTRRNILTSSVVAIAQFFRSKDKRRN